MNTLPRPKIHADANARARAYQERKRAERRAAAAVMSLVDAVDNPSQTSLASVLDELTPEQKEALRRLALSRNNVTNLKKEAA